VSLDQRILQAIAGLGGVEAVAIFGSRASDGARPDSDLDVALLPRSGDPAERRRLQADAAAALAGLAPGGRVDVLLLDEAPELVRQRVLETGRVLFGGESPAWRALRIRTMREHGDREWARDLLRRHQKDRLLRGEIGGRPRRALRAPGRARDLSR